MIYDAEARNKMFLDIIRKNSKINQIFDNGNKSKTSKFKEVDMSFQMMNNNDLPV